MQHYCSIKRPIRRQTLSFGLYICSASSLGGFNTLYECGQWIRGLHTAFHGIIYLRFLSSILFFLSLFCQFLFYSSYIQLFVHSILPSFLLLSFYSVSYLLYLCFHTSSCSSYLSSCSWCTSSTYAGDQLLRHRQTNAFLLQCLLVSRLRLRRKLTVTYFENHVEHNNALHGELVVP